MDSNIVKAIKLNNRDSAALIVTFPSKNHSEIGFSILKHIKCLLVYIC